jgi:hypothetical protein
LGGAVAARAVFNHGQRVEVRGVRVRAALHRAHVRVQRVHRIAEHVPLLNGRDIDGVRNKDDLVDDRDGRAGAVAHPACVEGAHARIDVVAHAIRVCVHPAAVADAAGVVSAYTVVHAVEDAVHVGVRFFEDTQQGEEVGDRDEVIAV